MGSLTGSERKGEREVRGEGRRPATLFLHSECVRRLGVEVGCILVLLGAAAEEAEASACGLGGFVCLASVLSASAWDFTGLSSTRIQVPEWRAAAHLLQ